MKLLDANTVQAWCLVQIDTRPFALALNAVAEIVEAEELVRLSLCSPVVLGLCAYRRDLLPVIALLDGPTAAPASGRPLVLIVRGEHGSWGLKIDRGGAVVAEGPLDDRRATAAKPFGPAVIGSITRGGTTYAAIDAEATWRNVRDAIERWYKGDRGRDQDRRHDVLDTPRLLP